MHNVEIPHCGGFTIRTERDAENAQRVADLIAHGSDPFGRDPHTDHITASAFVYSPRRETMLLTHHRKLNRWLQLGGHCDGIADPFAAAHREAIEESGLTDISPLSQSIVDIDIHTIPARGNDPAHQHFDLRYAFVADPDTPLVITAESNDLRWIPLTELHEYTQAQSALVARDIAKALPA